MMQLSAELKSTNSRCISTLCRGVVMSSAVDLVCFICKLVLVTTGFLEIGTMVAALTHFGMEQVDGGMVADWF